MKLLFLLLLFTCWYAGAASQVTTTTNIKKRLLHLDSTAIVHDSTGQLVPYNTWSPLLASGNYAIYARMAIPTAVTWYYGITAARKKSVLRM